MTKPSIFTSSDAVSAVEAETNRTGNDYRALVCVFLNGGNDSHNMIIPRAGSSNRIHYDLQRGVKYDPITGAELPYIGLDAGDELPLTTDWGINPNMPNTKALYDAGKMGVLMNVGLLAKPTTRSEYKSNTVPLPSQLFAHNSQQALWQALPYLGQTPKTGYMGRADDLVGEFFNFSASDDISGQFSISGRPLQMQGFDARSNDLQTTGPSSATASATNVPALYLTPARTRQVWNNKRQAMFANAVKSSVTKQAAITTHLQALPAPITTTFTGLSTANGNLGAQLSMVSRILLSRSNFSHRRDTFFVSIGGWDDHDGISSLYGPRLAQLDAALSAFWTALGQLGLQENVTVYTQSDFGRALKQNNDGSDHGWGGHALIMGGSVLGGQLFGEAPDFTTGSATDADQGRLIPTTSADQYAATMLKWWGVPESQLETVLPNLENFQTKTLPILREPMPFVATPKAYSLDLVGSVLSSGNLPSDVTYSRATSSACSQFDRDGNMIPSPVNAIPNSENLGLDALIGSTGTTTTHFLEWNSTASGTGLVTTLTGTGVENGMRYTEWQFKGTVTTTAYGQIAFSAFATLPQAIVTANGNTWTFFVKARRVAEKSPNPVNWVANLRATNTSGTGITGHDVSSSLGLAPSYGTAVSDVPIQLDRTMNVYDATATRIIPRLMMPGITVGTYVEDTIRVYEPMLIPGIWERPPAYLPTTGTAKALPRLDFDPATGRARGIMREPTRTNVIRNSIGLGSTAGVPGTMPSNWTKDEIAGVTVSVGVPRVVNNMRVTPFRIFGKATVSSNLNISFESFTQIAIATNDDWIGSVYASLVAGSLKNVSTANLEFIMYNSSVYVDAAGTSIAAINGGKISAQRWFVGKQVTNAAINQGRLQLRFSPVINEYVDFTIEVACPQLEKGRQASSWIPTAPGPNTSNGAIAVRAAEICEVVTGFSGWYNPTEGSLVVKGEPQVGQAGTRSSWPRVAGFSVLSSSVGTHVQDSYGIYALTSPDTAFNGRSGSAVSNANVASGDNSISSPVVANGKPATRALSYSAGFLQTSHRGVAGTSAVPTAYPAVTRLQIGLGLDSPLWVQSIDYYATKLTPTEMTVITSS